MSNSKISVFFKKMQKKIKSCFYINSNLRFNQWKEDGNSYLSAGNYAEAEVCYRRMISIFPERSGGYINLGFVLAENNQLDDAEFYIRKAIKIDNKNPDSFCILGRVLHKKNDLINAVKSFVLAASFCKDRDLFLTLADALFSLNEINESLLCLYGARSIAPDDQIIKYLIDSREGNNRPDTAPNKYIQGVFDTYADSFDEHLLVELDYRTPQELVALLNQEVNLTAQQWSVLDLGCGTGLLGQEMASYVNQMVGVDLSANMLEKAGARNVYTRLENADLTSMMRDESKSSYDIVMAADVFIYVGKLDEIFLEVKRVLKPHGFFMFSLEALEKTLNVDAHKTNQQDFRLNATARYAHSAQYIERLAQLNHFAIRKMVSSELRKNAGAPVIGWYVLCESLMLPNTFL
jgi:predicted TPR repeat methyltransferase